MTSPQPPIDYTSKDWAGFVDEMKTAATTRFPEWTSTDPNDFGIVLIESWAYLGDILSFYGDRIANESYLATATQYGSVLKIAALLDYQPRSTSPATVVLSVTIPALANTIVPAGTRVSTVSVADGQPIVFETDSQVVITAVAGETDPEATQTQSIPATQGLTVAGETVGVSTGLMDQDFTLLQQPVIDGSVVISVIETPGGAAQQWVVSAHLVDAGPTDNYYSTSLDANGALHVVFGDGTTGRIPPVGSVISATYRVGGGTAGNVGVGTLTTFVDVTQVVANSNGTLSNANVDVTNLSPATGGAGAESIQSIRQNAPAVFAAQDRAVTLEDFAALAVQVPTVAKARAVAKVYTNVVIYVAPDGGGTPNQSLLNLVVSAMQGKKMANVTVTASTPVYQGIDIEAVVEAGAPYTRSTVLQNVTTALANFFAFDNVDFADRVTLSAIYQVIQQSLGVVYTTIGILAPTGGTTASDVPLPDNAIPVLGNVNISVTGGVDVATPVGVIGSSTSGPTPPATPGTPTLDLMRCDPNSSHYEMHWDPSSDADHYEVVINYLSASGTYPDNIVRSEIHGPFTEASAAIDAALIGNASLPISQQAVSVQFTVQAFNGTAGPVTGSSLTTSYLCEQGSSDTTPPTPPGAPQISNIAVEGYDTNGNPIYAFDVSWTPSANTDNTALVYEVLDASGNILTGSGSTNPGTSTNLSSFTVTTPKDITNGIRLYVAAYNGGVGPVNGPSATIPITTPMTGTYVGQPALTSATWLSYTRAGSGSISGEVTVVGHNIDSVSIVVEYIAADGTVSPHSYTMTGGGTGPGSSDSSYAVNVGAAAPDAGFTATQVRVTVYANNSNGTSAGQQTVHSY